MERNEQYWKSILLVELEVGFLLELFCEMDFKIKDVAHY